MNDETTTLGLPRFDGSRRRARSSSAAKRRESRAPSAVGAQGQPSTLSLAAVGLVIGSAACFTAIDTIVKYIGLRYSVPTLVWARWGIPALLMLIVFGPKMRWGLVRTMNPRLHVLRGLVLMLSSVCFFSALKFLPLAEATGINYSTPILVTLLAGWFLGEKITRPRWLFVIAGFVGVLLIIQPRSWIPSAAAPLAIAAAGLNAVFQILTRKLAREDLMVLIFYPALVGAVLMSLAIPFVDAQTRYLGSDLLLLLAIGAIGALGHFLFIHAFQRAPASAIAPFTYVQLIWSSLAGWLVFNTFPDGWALTGLTLIAGSGALLTWYERFRLRKAASDASGLEARQSSVLISIPGAGLAGLTFEGSSMALADNVFHSAVRDGSLIPSGRESSRTVIKTD